MKKILFIAITLATFSGLHAQTNIKAERDNSRIVLQGSSYNVQPKNDLVITVDSAFSQGGTVNGLVADTTFIYLPDFSTTGDYGQKYTVYNYTPGDTVNCTFIYPALTSQKINGTQTYLRLGNRTTINKSYTRLTWVGGSVGWYGE